MKKTVALCMGFALLVFATVSCVKTNRQVSSDMQASVTKDFRKESYLKGIAYQLSAEVKGLQIQAFKLARIQLDQRLLERDQGKYARPIAIISDIDDALADDAMYMADIVLREGKWDITMMQWALQPVKLCPAPLSFYNTLRVKASKFSILPIEIGINTI